MHPTAKSAGTFLVSVGLTILAGLLGGALAALVCGVCLVLGAAILVAFGWAPARSWLGLPGTPRDESPDTDPSQQLSALAGEWQAWWNKVTRMLRERGYRPDAKTTLTDWQTKPIHLDWESTDEYRHAYLELRNEGLEFVERAVQLGEMDEQMRIRFP
jgi:hypothetical protein